MNITDLNYLVPLSEETQLTGGRRRSAVSTQTNVAVVLQSSYSSSKAISFGGDAIAISYAFNQSDIGQGNISL
jgi:hypothetical protein